MSEIMNYFDYFIIYIIKGNVTNSIFYIISKQFLSSL